MEVFESTKFRQVIEKVYKLRSPHNEVCQSIPLYKPRIGQTLIYLPFGFFPSQEMRLRIEQSINTPSIHDLIRSRGMDINLHFVERMEEPSGLDCSNVWCKTHVSMNSELHLADLTSSLDASSRNHVRNVKKERNKAVRHGVSFSWVTDNEDLRQFHWILAKQYLRQHRMLFQPYQLFSQLFSLGIGHLAIARRGEEVLAGMFMTFDGNTWRYNWGARREWSGISAGTILMDWVLNQAISEGVAIFDFGASSIMDVSLLESKSRWGANHLPVYRYSTKTSTWYADLHTSLWRSRWILTHVPSFVAQPLARLWAPLTVR